MGEKNLCYTYLGHPPPPISTHSHHSNLRPLLPGEEDRDLWDHLHWSSADCISFNADMSVHCALSERKQTSMVTLELNDLVTATFLFAVVTIQQVQSAPLLLQYQLQYVHSGRAAKGPHHNQAVAQVHQ